MFEPNKRFPGNFSPRDGTIDFYLRVRSFLNADSVVVDLGAGRAAWFEEPDSIVKTIRHVKPDVREVVAVDFDAIVAENRAATRSVLMEGNAIPLPDHYADLIVSDFVCEHVEDPRAFMAEISRLLKPGGVFCARTPHALHYVSIAARLTPNRRHSNVIRYLQPSREAQDVFPTFYRMNTLANLQAIAPSWKNQSFIFRTEPSYFFGSKLVHAVLSAFHELMPKPLCGSIFIFLTKPASNSV